MNAPVQPASFRTRTVGDIAATLPGATQVFRKFKLDFCCGGDVALDEAARKRGVDPATLEEALTALETASHEAPVSLRTDDLIAHILTRYHETHRRELPELIKLARRVEAVHAEHPKVPRGLADTLQHMHGELVMHMQKEELILFPAMRSMAAQGLNGPIAQMRHDHDDHGVQLRKLESLTDHFTLPDDACRSWQALYAGAAKTVNDLMEHIHLENNVLFPRFEAKAAH